MIICFAYVRIDSCFGLQSRHESLTVPLRCSTVCLRKHENMTLSDGLKIVTILAYVGSNPAGENRCLVVKASKQNTPVTCAY